MQAFLSLSPVSTDDVSRTEDDDISHYQIVTAHGTLLPITQYRNLHVILLGIEGPELALFLVVVDGTNEYHHYHSSEDCRALQPSEGLLRKRARDNRTEGECK